MTLDRVRRAALADYLAAAVAISLPWSTSATSVLVDLFDFMQGWLYVFGVGIAGGALLRANEG